MTLLHATKHILAGALAVLVLAPASFAQQNTGQLHDTDMLAAIEAVFRSDEVVPSHMIDVYVSDGIVTLMGQADTLLSNRRAVTLSESVRGVRSVVDRLKVQTAVGDDQSTLERVRETLRDDPAVELDQVKVSVKGGKVTLEGTVDSYAEAQIAHDAILGLRGIVALDNKIVVEPKMNRKDAEIKSDVEGRLANDPWLSGQSIVVNVDDATVEMSGLVGSAAEKAIAYRLGWVAGAKFVNSSKIEVKRWLKRRLQRDGKTVLRDDVELKKAVEDAFLYDPRLRGNKVDVAVRKGVVSLAGKVSTLAASRAAELDANNTLGVRRVRNYLKVQRENWPGDTTITERVRKNLSRDAHVGMLDIDASSHFGKLYLRGTVQSQFEKQRAELLAANVAGVLEVVNRLSVDYTWADKSDWELKEDVESQFLWSPFVDGDSVDVSVNDGIVTLSGMVDSNQERGAAKDNAEQAGARRVINQLTVSDS